MPEPVPVPGGGRGTVGGAVTFDAQQVLPRPVGMADGQVDPVPGGTDPGVHRVAPRPDDPGHLRLDVAAGAGRRRGRVVGQGGRAAGREIQVPAQVQRTGRVTPVIRVGANELTISTRRRARVIATFSRRQPPSRFSGRSSC